MKMIGNVSDWLSYAGGALIKVADSAGSTVDQFMLVFVSFILFNFQTNHGSLTIYERNASK